MKSQRIAGIVLFFIAAAIFGALWVSKTSKNSAPPEPLLQAAAKLVLKSPAFKEGGNLPVQYTCDGAGISPPLQWSGVPHNAKTLALICTDPDAPSGEWTHWLLWNLPSPATRLLEKLPTDDKLASGAIQGTNDFKKTGWGGACPPSGTHRYVFTMYAIDSTLALAPGAGKAELLKAIEGHILAQGQLTAKYSRGS